MSKKRTVEVHHGEMVAHHYEPQQMTRTQVRYHALQFATAIPTRWVGHHPSDDDPPGGDAWVASMVSIARGFEAYMLNEERDELYE